MNWEKMKLGALCNFVNGKAYKESDWKDTGIPIVRIQNLNNCDKGFNYWAGPTEKQVVIKDGDLLLAWSGTPGTSFGAHLWNRGKAVLNQHIFRVDIDEAKISKQWALRSINNKLNELISRAHGGVGLQHVTKGVIENIVISVPPINEQHRIVSILNKADGIGEKRKRTLELADQFLKSVFLDMFGDPVANSKGWKLCHLSDVVDNITSGKSPNCLNRPANDNEYGVLKLGAVTKCYYIESENKALPNDIVLQDKAFVQEGDILFTRKNTKELVGASAIVERTSGRIFIPDLIYKIKLKKGHVDKHYVHGLFTHLGFRKKIQSLAEGAAGSMPNISRAKLLLLELPIPPMSMQRNYSDVRTAALRNSQEAERALQQAENLSNALSAQAFNGEL